MRLSQFVKQSIAAYFTFFVLLMMTIIFISLGVMSFSIIGMANQREAYYKTYEIKALFNTYREKGLEAAFEDSDGMVGYMEFLNAKRQVKDEIHSPNGFGYSYSDEAFRDMVARDKEFIFYYPYADANDAFVIYAPKLAGPTPIVDIVLFHLMGFLLLITMLMAYMVYQVRLRFVRPVILMKHAVEAIGDGAASIQIDYKSDNELNVLKDSIVQMGETIHQQMTALKVAEIERKRMVLSLSHDIRTPLTNISGYAETLKTDLDLSKEEQSKAIEVIYNNTQRAKNLINGLFDYAKFDSDQLRVMHVPTDVVGRLRDCVIHYYPDLELKGMSLALDLPETQVVATLDPMLFERLIGNLLSNALRYAYDDGTLSVGLEHTDSKICIIIQDQGPGIPNEIHDTLFDPFVTGDEARTHKSGTGLGLTIAKRLAERLGGYLEWDKSYTGGVRWNIVLMYD